MTATAGAGKSTAVAQYVESREAPVAWLRADDGDIAAGRFLLYLERAIRIARPDHPAKVEEALARGISQQDTAALLAESTAGLDLLVVIDEIEHIADSTGSRSVLSAFLSYAGPSTKVILISRRNVDLGLARAELYGRVGHVREHDLAFSIGEAEEALTRLDRSEGVDVADAVRATGGWVTGVLFESWRSAHHVPGSGGEADPLNSFLSSEIMAALDTRCQDFLIRTAVLDVVSPQRAAQLGIKDGADTMRVLYDAHLPVEFDGPSRMRSHARFRDYLIDRWAELEETTQADIRYRYGQLLVLEGCPEEAVTQFLSAGDPAQAEDVAAEVILDVARRGDLELVERWLDAFRSWRVDSVPAFIAADLLVGLDHEEFGRAARAADRLLQVGDTALLSDSRLLSVMAWGYFVAGRVEDSLRVLDQLGPRDPQTAAMRFCIGVELVDDQAHYRDRPADTHTETDGLLARVDLAHGRFRELVDRGEIPLTAVRLAQVGALAGLGRLEEAQERLPANVSGWTYTRMQVEILAESGRPAEAWSALIAGRERLAASESPLYRMFALLAEAHLSLRFGRDVEHARALLRAVEQQPTAMRRVRVLEQLALWKGLIALLEDDVSEAANQLNAAVSLMTKWDRRLFLPMAAVYLAEAQWRANNEDLADAAADLALRTATEIGSTQLLNDSLADFPAVLSRRLDIEVDPDGPWHDLGRTLIINAETSEVVRPATLCVDELDTPAVVLSGRRHPVKLVKCIELLSYLATAGGSAPRADVISALFESKNDQAANAYLRIAVNGIRDLTGDPECIQVGDGHIRWSGGILTSTYVSTMTAYRRVRAANGPERLGLSMQLFNELDGKTILQGARSIWALDHQQRWAALVLDICHTAAEAAYDTARYGLAHRLVGQVLARDAYRERAWRLSMKIAAAVGDTDRVIAAYRDCEKALGELPTTPSKATRELLARLR
ncbi:BTAD domain-containing putative transcriptional regulator [Mycobacterium sp. pW049]|uniref:BTAD domain-containing putative transcriptional regulator n=1 Tax=[Mycobacterium] bulgaricum TaxID=3238985 RepID=UPI00351B2E7E